MATLECKELPNHNSHILVDQCSNRCLVTLVSVKGLMAEIGGSSVIFFLFHQEFRVDDTLNINAWSSFKQMSCTTKTKCKVPAYQGVGSGGFNLPSFSLYKLCIFKASFALAKHLEECPY